MRGIAILLVLVGHMFQSLNPLAAAGVALFLTLSGYLITGLLMTEYERTGTLNLRRFYTRRLTRLAPPLCAMLAVMGVVYATDWRVLATSILWVTNYASIFFGLNVEPFGHTWSLAVEEQFYLLWPVAFLALMRTRRAPAILLGVLVALTIWRLLLTYHGFWNYAYSALETAGVPILGGCLLALARVRRPRRGAGLSLTGLLVVTLAMSLVPVGDLWLIAPVVILPAAVGLVAAAGGCRWLGAPPLAFMGVASYSMYLWHKPVAWLIEGWTPLGVGVGALVGLVAYFVVEMPVMRWRASGSRRPVEASPASRSGATDDPRSGRRAETAAAAARPSS